jgi:riboflavin synthase
MFTGIIEEIGQIKAIIRGSKSIRLTIICSRVIEGIKPGDSIAVNGICLTAAALGPGWFAADVMPETLRRTGLQKIRPQDTVNLERALRLCDRLGGHLVSGHTDGTGQLIRRDQEDNAIWLTIEAAPEILRYVVTKGSITLDGVSLTVAAVDQATLQVALIPHTASLTTLGSRAVGESVNIECDVIGKYVEKFVQATRSGLDTIGQNIESKSGLTMAFLHDNGFN